MYVRIGFRLSSLDVGTCARICRLGAILGSCTCTSTIRVRVRVRLGLGFSGSRGRHAGQYFGRHGLKVSIGYRLPPLDMGPCAWIPRSGAVLGTPAPRMETLTLTLTLILLVPVPRPRIAPNRRLRAHGPMSSGDNRYPILTFKPCLPKY